MHGTRLHLAPRRTGGFGTLFAVALVLGGCSESGGSSGGEQPANDQPLRIPTLASLGVPVTTPTTTTPVAVPPITTPPATTPPPVTTPPATTPPPVTTPPTTTPPPVTTPPTTTPPPVTTPPTTTPPPVTTPPTTTPPPVTTPPTTTPAGEPLAALFGTLGFEWSFDTDATVFRDSVRFDAGDLDLLESGDSILVTTDSGQWDGGFGCLAADGDLDDAYLCLGFYDSGALNIFFFGLDATGARGNGLFEFCTPEEADGCAEDAASTPDGAVTVSVDRLAKRAAGDRSVDDRDVVTGDLETYMTGLDQADAPRANANGTEDDRYDALVESVCRHLGACR